MEKKEIYTRDEVDEIFNSIIATIENSRDRFVHGANDPYINYASGSRDVQAEYSASAEAIETVLRNVARMINNFKE